MDLTDTLDEDFGTLEALFPSEDELPPLLVLIVDDEPYVLRSLQRLLRSMEVEVLTASSGTEAIEIFERGEPIAVLISDQFMPKMSGAELLEYARQNHQDTIRVMLTGNNDLSTAIEAINRGDVFRFVLKPWVNEAITRIVELALEQHMILLNHRKYQRYIRDQNERLQFINDELERRVAERTRDLLESRKEIEALYEELQLSFDAALKAMLSTMELGEIKIVDHCRRAATRVQQLCDELLLGEGVSQPLVRASLLHWIGLVNVPEAFFVQGIDELSDELRATWEYHALLGYQVMQTVEALKYPGQIVLHHLKRYDDFEFRPNQHFEGMLLTEDFVLSCRVLHLCSAFERERTMASSQARLRAGEATSERGERYFVERGLYALKQGRGTLFDPSLVSRFSDMIERLYMEYRREMRLTTILDLKPGMVLSRPIETLQGLPVAPRDLTITSDILRRLDVFQHTGGLGPIFVWH